MSEPDPRDDEIARLRALVSAARREWYPAAKLNRITPGLHDAMGEIVAYCREALPDEH